MNLFVSGFCAASCLTCLLGKHWWPAAFVGVFAALNLAFALALHG